MSSTVYRFAWSATKSKFLVSVAATVMLAACSADTERFASNPSDADPVYTASVPKEASASPRLPAAADESISSKPLTSASAKPPAYDYSKSYQAPQYKQPAITQAPSYAEPEAAVPQPEVAEAPSVPAGGTSLSVPA